ncbi:PREDICTED: putative F-box protein At1g47790 [Camelina sativa]|uniref:F-box protein At1g47790 n=1 Tax=Camelina sativa TaxID=90675 RepID=A0ABM0VYU4_CAMSA|nr:PREDICTED: putative F-box protein At1g47790 [Camelina sativa]
MEQPKEKRRKGGYRKRRRQLKLTLPFPADLNLEILLRLPARSVLRFRCVSKLWSSITTDSYFINSYETRFSTLRPSLLVCFIANGKLFVSSIPQDNQNSKESSYSCSQPIYRYNMKFPQGPCYFPPTESVHGLICFQVSASPVIWNPSKRQLLTFPKPDENWSNITMFLGYDPVEGKHKIMCIPDSRSSEVCRVLTLGSAQESWRTVKTNHNHYSDYNTFGRCIKGVIYYIADIYHKGVWVIISFDVRFERFGMIDLPTDIYRDMLISYEGKLAVVENKGIDWKSKLWILEDAGKQKWSRKEFLVPFRYHQKGVELKLKSFTHTGELIYVPPTFHKSDYILFCDPVRESFRRFQFKGIADDESGNGVRNGYVLHSFPNHL